MTCKGCFVWYQKKKYQQIKVTFNYLPILYDWCERVSFQRMAKSRGCRWVVGRASWVVGHGSCVMRRASCVVRRGSWVVGRGSWVTREYCFLRVLTLKSPHGLMSVKSKSESIQNVTMFNIFLLESLDASCKDYLISCVRTLSYDWPKTNFAN